MAESKRPYQGVRNMLAGYVPEERAPQHRCSQCWTGMYGKSNIPCRNEAREQQQKLAALAAQIGKAQDDDE